MSGEIKDISQISYWNDEENILTVPTVKVPEVNEVVHIETLMDKDWYDARFPNRKLFRKGVRGKYRVLEVVRYYNSYDYVLEDKVGESIYNFPSQKIVENFEVSLEEIEK